jgi:purine-binding chemotaxis protein CheW
MAADTDTFILFELAGATYAIPSSNVQHIEMLEHVTPVPNAHRAIDGVVFSRGQVIPALNLRTRFGFPRQETGLQTRVVFVQLQQRTVGFIVDSAREFKNVPTAQIRPIEKALTGIAGNYLRGLTNINNRLVLILDLEAVLNLDQDESLAASLSNVINQSGDLAPAATTS